MTDKEMTVHLIPVQKEGEYLGSTRMICVLNGEDTGDDAVIDYPFDEMVKFIKDLTQIAMTDWNRFPQDEIRAEVNFMLHRMEEILLAAFGARDHLYAIGTAEARENYMQRLLQSVLNAN